MSTAVEHYIGPTRSECVQKISLDLRLITYLDIQVDLKFGTLQVLKTVLPSSSCDKHENGFGG